MPLLHAGSQSNHVNCASIASATLECDAANLECAHRARFQLPEIATPLRYWPDAVIAWSTTWPARLASESLPAGVQLAMVNSNAPLASTVPFTVDVLFATVVQEPSAIPFRTTSATGLQAVRSRK